MGEFNPSILVIFVLVSVVFMMMIDPDKMAKENRAWGCVFAFLMLVDVFILVGAAFFWK